MAASLSRSPEEEDHLKTSTKKSKMTVVDCYTDSVEIVMETLTTSNTVDDLGLQISGNPMPEHPFRDTLLGDNGRDSHVSYSDDEGFISDEDEMCKDGDEDDCLTIRVSREDKARLRRPWRQTLIIKVMGRTVGFNYLSKEI
ncbi:hypothetical protein PTKIN_Ptkin05aG0139200 [Pterospermum kingtungense]